MAPFEKLTDTADGQGLNSWISLHQLITTVFSTRKRCLAASWEAAAAPARSFVLLLVVALFALEATAADPYPGAGVRNPLFSGTHALRGEMGKKRRGGAGAGEDPAECSARDSWSSTVTTGVDDELERVDIRLKVGRVLPYLLLWHARKCVGFSVTMDAMC